MVTWTWTIPLGIETGGLGMTRTVSGGTAVAAGVVVVVVVVVVVTATGLLAGRARGGTV
jgi:hypothetical protein